MSRIDPIQIAQFFALPGASELVEAFSAIPPGPVRDSVVHHAQVLAQAAGWTPPVPFVTPHAQDPARTLGGPPPRLQSPFATGLQAQSQDGQVIERLMRGEAEEVVADTMGLPLGVVQRLKAKARKEGGLSFPDDDLEALKRGKAKAKAKPKKAKRGRGWAVDRIPVPAPPYWWEDPDSPVWDNPRLLPAFSESGEGSMAAIGPLDHRTFVTMKAGADRNGLTMRQYIARRLDIVRRIRAGARPVDVALKCRVAPFVVWGLLRKVGESRMETLNNHHREALEAEDGPGEPGEPLDRPEALAPPAGSPEAHPADPEPVQAAVGRPIQAHVLHQRRMAARHWGFPDLESYEAARLRVRELRLQSVPPSDIMARLEVPAAFIKNATEYWQRSGVRFPLGHKTSRSDAA